MKSKLQSGVALVVTLLMLSVITFLAIAFLALTRRDRTSVTVSLDQTGAANMAAAALARAQSEVSLQMQLTNDLLQFGLMVSTNYVNPAGYTASIMDPTNVNYDRYYGTTNPLTAGDFLTNIANLFYDPRPPVFIKTNSNSKFPADFRFWLDYNHNGLFETNGFQPVMSGSGIPYGTNGVPSQNPPWAMASYVGEPEWIGVLKNPEYPHSPTNQFIGRYCYLVLPIGKTLDLNYIHNYAKRIDRRMRVDAYLRNQGVGSWEINLAAFLHGLDPNAVTWASVARPYNYRTNCAPAPLSSTGNAFDDALAMLTYRYNKDYKNLNFVQSLFPNNLYQTDGFDGYADGPLDLTGRGLNVPELPPENVNEAWSGSDNPTMFYDMQELFDANKTGGFVGRLQSMVNVQSNGVNPDSINRYTFSRLLNGIGTDSAVEQCIVTNDAGLPVLRNKININYTNDANTPRLGSTHFFTNAAELLLRSQYTFGLTNIPIYNPSNATVRYDEAIHRMLQLAANIYDSSNTNNLPSVFRPQFRTDNGTNYIAGYVEETGTSFMSRPWHDISEPLTNADDNVWGIPLIIGVKKGYPNFNEYSYNIGYQMTRKLHLHRPDTNSVPNLTNQLYIVGVSNSFGAEIWNSYTQAFTRPVTIFATNIVQMVMTNERGTIIKSNYTVVGTNMPPVTFIGAKTNYSANIAFPNKNFYLPIQTNNAFLTNSVITHDGVVLGNTNIFESAMGATQRIYVTITNKLMYAMVENGRILDFVNFADLGGFLDVDHILNKEVDYSALGLQGPNPLQLIWNNSPSNGTTAGVVVQLNASAGSMGTIDSAVWRNFTGTAEVRSEIQNFQRFLWGSKSPYPNPPYVDTDTPFNPVATFIKRYQFQANDPLVHYTASDLINPQKPIEGNRAEVVRPTDNYAKKMTNSNLGSLNSRYHPWGGYPGALSGEDAVTDPNQEGAYNLTFKDPLIKKSDDWAFPTNQFPSIGWIGRVHRGTPWQTFFLKAEKPEERSDNMQKWTNYWVITDKTYPTNDWRLIDVFTTAPNDNAAKGALSVNQTDIAPWSAILSGAIVSTNAKGATVIDPSTVPLIVNEINALRASKTNQLFHRIGEILEATNLTVTSQFITNADFQTNITDEAVERIPQQTLSLLHLGQPRFVIYSYGQALKPKDLASGAAGANFNLCTNYQITGEVVTRTVCRVDNVTDNARAVRPKFVIENFNLLPGD